MKTLYVYDKADLCNAINSLADAAEESNHMASEDVAHRRKALIALVAEASDKVEVTVENGVEYATATGIGL
jgi:hypothetical protein